MRKLISQSQRKFSATLLGAIFALASPASAATIDLQPTFVPGSAASGGPMFTTTVFWSPGDTLRAIVGGTVNFDVNNVGNFDAEWNAAGIVTQTSTSVLTVGGTSQFYINQGWLRLALGNDSLGYFPLFDVSPANGLGSSTPPTNLLLSRTVGEVFTSNGFGGIPTGTLLQYRIFDNPTHDNTGGFSISAVPEPNSWMLLGGGLLAVSCFMRKRSVGSVETS